jgi:hypothetical protein
VIGGTYYDNTLGLVPALWQWDGSVIGGGWSVVNQPVPQGFQANQVSIPSMSCGSSTFCIAGTFWQNNAGGAIGTRGFLEVRNGTTWSGSESNYTINSQYTYIDLRSTSCDAATSCWAVGNQDWGSQAVPFAVHVGMATPPPPGVTTAQVATWFHPVLLPGGLAAKIGNLLKANGFSTTLVLGRAGSARVAWTATVIVSGHSHVVVVATLLKTLAAGHDAVKVVLTTAGRQLLLHASHLAIKTYASLTVTGHPAVAVANHLTLYR